MTTATGATAGRWPGVMHELGRAFAQAAPGHDERDAFVEANVAALKNAKAFSAQIPEELGGGGASYGELCDLIRILGSYCGSTALAFSMHNHLVAVLVWRWRNQKAPVDALLKRVAAEQLVLVSTGGADWLHGSGRAEKVDGGFRYTGRKVFASGVPAGDLLMTMGVVENGTNGNDVIHFAMPLKSPEVKILDTWRVMGMRGTGSHDVQIDGAFVPDAAVALTRPQGKWHPSMHTVALVALPVIYAAYLGVAEGARDIAVKACAKKRDNADVQGLAGEMDTELEAARLAWRSMVELGAAAAPGEDATNAVLKRRTLCARSAIRAVELAMQAVGGASFYRSTGLERHFRDIQGARFHPLAEKPQARYAGRRALGLPVDE